MNRRARINNRRENCGELLPAPAGWAAAIGKTFGQLTVLGYTGRKSQHGHKLVTCRCSCGWFNDAPLHNIMHGSTISCGCVRNARMAARNRQNKTHGHSCGGKTTAEYAAWQAMKKRCLDPLHAAYSLYGARGIAVCERWQRSFENFFQDVGPRPSRLFSLDRIDNNKGYEPGNVRWATAKQQGRNQRQTRWYELDGVKKPLATWAEEYGVSYATVLSRIDKFGWALFEALTKSVGGGGPCQHSVPKPERARLRAVWYAMIQRCHDPAHARFADYGGRGIVVCERWRNSFEAFFADVGCRPSPQHTLDRKDNNAGYVPENMRWATASEQNRNRRSTKYYELAGETRSLAEWAALASKPLHLVRRRLLEYSWSLDEALGTPTGGMGRSVLADRRKWTERFAAEGAQA